MILSKHPLNLSLVFFFSSLSVVLTSTPAPAEAQIETQIGDQIACDEDADCFLRQGIQVYQAGQMNQAVQLFEQALRHYRRDKDREGEADALNNLGESYRNLSYFAQALETLEEALALMQDLGDTCPEISRRRQLELSCNPNWGEAAVRHNLSLVYERLGDLERAAELYEQAKNLESSLGASRSGVLISSDRREYFRSPLSLSLEMVGGRNCVEPSLESARIETDDRLAIVLETFNLQLIGRGNRQDDATIWRDRGDIYRHRGYCQQALSQYNQALVIYQEIGDRAGESSMFSRIGQISEKQGQSVAAIGFYKQAVNIQEDIRRELQDLPNQVQQTYTDTVASTYRRLADLLFAQGRFLEAQQVLELLKVEELRQSTRSSVSSTGEIEFTRAEARILEQYGSLIAFGQQIRDCDPNCPAELYAQQTQLQDEYNTTVQNLEEAIRERAGQDPAFLDPNRLSNAAKDILQNAKTPTILIYPFVTKKKLWIFWATVGGDNSILTNAIDIEIDQATLSKQIYAFRKLMEDCETKICETQDIPAAQAAAHTLYKSLLPPQLVQEIEQNQIENLVFSLDRVTRYIPMAALFDGEQYLIQRYTVSTILSVGLTRYDNPLPPGTSNTSVLALGLSQAVPANPAEDMPAFGALAYVRNELEAIVQQGNSGIYPGIKRLDRRFDLDVLSTETRRHQILHIATHGKFVPAAGLEQSYLVLGTKQPLRIPQLEDLKQAFAGLSLVVLSACQTALGEASEDGIEIASMAHSFIDAGVNSVVASLWQVEDRSTALLMQQFYRNLAQGTGGQSVPVSQALRDAQRSLISSSTASSGNPAPRDSGSSTSNAASNATNNATSNATSNANAPDATVEIHVNGVPATGKPDYAHPYYWAPFILIGNGL